MLESVEMKQYLVILLLLMMFAGCGSRQHGDEFESIRQLVCDGHYEQAVPQLKSYEGRHASRAGLFLGKSHLALGDLPQARAAFEDTIRRFPQSLEAHKCRYKLALVTWLEGDTESAREQFAALSQNPDGPLAPEATALVEFIQ